MNAFSFMAAFAAFLALVAAMLAGQRTWLSALDASFQERLHETRVAWFCLFAKDVSRSGATLLFFAPQAVNASCGLNVRWSDGLVVHGR